MSQKPNKKKICKHGTDNLLQENLIDDKNSDDELILIITLQILRIIQKLLHTRNDQKQGLSELFGLTKKHTQKNIVVN